MTLCPGRPSEKQSSDGIKTVRTLAERSARERSLVLRAENGRGSLTKI